MSAGYLGLPRERRERGSLATDHAPGEVDPFATEKRKEDAVAVAGITGQFGKVGVFRSGRGGRDRDRCGISAVERDVKATGIEGAFDQHHRVAVGPQGWQTTRNQTEAGARGIARNRHVGGPGDRLHRELADGRPGCFRIGTVFRHRQHASGGAGKRREAWPVDMRAHAEAGDRNPLGPQEVDHPRKVVGVDPAERWPVADVDDRARSFDCSQLHRGSFDRGKEVGRAERGAAVQGESRLAERVALPRVESICQRRAGDVDGGCGEPVIGPRLLEQSGE